MLRTPSNKGSWKLWTEPGLVSHLTEEEAEGRASGSDLPKGSNGWGLGLGSTLLTPSWAFL